MALNAGVSTSQACVSVFEQFKMKDLYDFVIFKANDKMNEIVVDASPAVGESEKVWKTIGQKCSVAREKDEPVEYWNMRRMILETKEPRYATVKIAHPATVKLVMVYWSPDDAATKPKMVYSSTKTDFKSKLNGIQSMLQCNDLEELSYNEVFKGSARN